MPNSVTFAEEGLCFRSGSTRVEFIDNKLWAYSSSIEQLTSSRLDTSNEITVAAWQMTTGSAGDKDVQLRIFSQSTGESNDRFPFYVSSSGKIGIGTDDPVDDFDIRTSVDSSTGTKFNLRSSRPDDGAVQVGDIAGEINFIVESSSFINLGDEGSLAKIYCEVTDVTSTGAVGDLKIRLYKGTAGAGDDVLTYQYAPETVSEFAVQHSASILMNDYNAGVKSRFRMNDSSGNTKFEIRQGAVTASIVSASGGLIGPLDGGTF